MLAGRVIVKMNVGREVGRTGEMRLCTGAREGSESPQGQSIPKGLWDMRNTLSRDF